jgi:hypothetical protein
MKQPTPHQRYKIYVMALSGLKNQPDAFLCNLISYGYDRMMYGVKTDFESKDIILLFPEFIAQRPEKPYSQDVWFNRKELGDSKVFDLRVAVLKQCIETIGQFEKKESDNE